MTSNITLNRTEAIETNDIIPGLSQRRMLPISAMKPQGGIITGDDCFFPVKVERATLSTGELTPDAYIVNEQSGRAVGRYLREGSLLRNESLVETFEKKMSEAGFEFTVSYRCFANGDFENARFEAVYTITNGPSMEVAGDAVGLEIILKNSYDGSWTISMSRRTRRLICLNGMESTVDEIALCKKHSAKLDLSKLAFKIEDTVNGAAIEAKQFDKMTGRVFESDEAKLNYLGNAVRFSKGGLSKRLASRFALESVLGDDTDPDDSKSLWGLYNVGTRVIRDLAEVRPDQAAKAGKAWSNLCVLAANPSLSSFAKKAWPTMIGEPDAKHRLIDVESEELETVEG